MLEKIKLAFKDVLCRFEKHDYDEWSAGMGQYLEAGRIICRYKVEARECKHCQNADERPVNGVWS